MNRNVGMFNLSCDTVQHHLTFISVHGWYFWTCQSGMFFLYMHGLLLCRHANQKHVLKVFTVNGLLSLWCFSKKHPFIGDGMNYSKGDLCVSFGKSLAKKYYGIKQETHWSRKSQWGMAVIEESHVFSLDIWSRDGWDSMQSVRNLSTLGDTRRLTLTQAAVIHIWKQKTLQPGETEFCSCQVADGTDTQPQLFSAFLARITRASTTLACNYVIF